MTLEGRRYPQHIYSGNVIANISGALVQLASGTGPILIETSGEAIKISGETVIALTSGQVAKVSGQVVKISGEAVKIFPPTVFRARPVITPTANSGGTILLSGDCNTMTIHSLSGDVWVGGVTAPDLPYSGNGVLLKTGAVLSVDIDNFNRIRVCANVSGSFVAYGGVRC